MPDEPLERDSRDYQAYQKLLVILGIWILAVSCAVSFIDVRSTIERLWETPGYDVKYGYTKSLVLLFLPLVFWVRWYQKSRDELELRPLMRNVLRNLVVVAGSWILLDVFLANLIFEFPDPDSHLLPMFWGYSWDEGCRLWAVSCYSRSIPSEEILFYAGGAAVLPGMYMWGAEDFYSRYSRPRIEYQESLRRGGPLVSWNRTLIATGILIAVAGVVIKKAGWLHTHTEGLPYYLFAETLIVFVPLAAFYNRVHRFTNTRAFLFVMALHVLVSLLWEATLALPYGWWDYRLTAMVGITVAPWSDLAAEAYFLWLSVGWASMFIYEATKIKTLAGRSWPQTLCGRNTWLGCLGLGS